jgi:prefoldin subunit 5
MKNKSLETEFLRLQTNLSKFKTLEQRALQTKTRLLEKLPDIEKTLEAVQALLAKGDNDAAIEVDFEITDGFLAKAALQQVNSVNLWLGAGIMVEYPLEEAQQLLQSNLAAAKERLEQVQQELDYAKDCATVTEVSIARVFNWDVEQRRKQKGTS